MSYQQWGNATWFLFHTLSEKLRPEYSNFAPKLFAEFYKICDNLPCPDCRDHAIRTLATAKINNIRERNDLIHFMWSFHNIVNNRTKKTFYSKEECLAKYKTANTRLIILHFRDIMNINHRIEKAMLGTFRRQQAVSKFLNFMQEHHKKFNP